MKADKAMYQIKIKDKNGLFVYSENENSQ